MQTVNYGLWDWIGIAPCMGLAWDQGTYESRSCPFPLDRPVSRKAGKNKETNKKTWKKLKLSCLYIGDPFF